MKIALINALFFPSENYHLVNDYYDTSESFFRSAKNQFLTNHEVHHILITNIQKKLPLDFVEHVIADYHPTEYHHLLFMKVLCLQFLKEKYDYIFVADADQIVVSQITDNDLLDKEYVFMGHFFNTLFKDALPSMTKFIDVNFPEGATWTMGNFYGGKYEHVMNMYRIAQEHHNSLYPEKVMEEFGFYCKFPDELFIAKYAYENDVDYKVLSCNATFTSGLKLFLSDFSTQEEDYVDTSNVRMLHNTKKDINLLKKLVKKYEY